MFIRHSHEPIMYIRHSQQPIVYPSDATTCFFNSNISTCCGVSRQISGQHYNSFRVRQNTQQCGRDPIWFAIIITM